MGIRIDDPPGPFGDDQGACWAAGVTPLILHATFSGIKTGALWNPVFHPHPPNRTFDYTQNAGPFFHWLHNGGVWLGAIIFEQMFIPGSNIGIGNLLPPPNDWLAFLGFNANDCTFFFENEQAVAAGNVFFGGKCQITSSA